MIPDNILSRYSQPAKEFRIGDDYLVYSPTNVKYAIWRIVQVHPLRGRILESGFYDGVCWTINTRNDLSEYSLSTTVDCWLEEPQLFKEMRAACESQIKE